jgi:hypothetical protein
MMSKYENKLIFLTVFTIAYIGFGVYSPVKMSLINNILMSCVNIAMFTVSNLVIETSLVIRGLLW